MTAEGRETNGLLTRKAVEGFLGVRHDDLVIAQVHRLNPVGSAISSIRLLQ